MTTKQQHQAEITKLEPHEQREPQRTIVAGPPEQLAVADFGGGEVVFFDTPLAFNWGGGVASITLTTTQQLVGSDGTPFEQRRIVAVLKSSLPALLHLKNVIALIEQRIEGEAAAAAAAIQQSAGSAVH